MSNLVDKGSISIVEIRNGYMDEKGLELLILPTKSVGLLKVRMQKELGINIDYRVIVEIPYEDYLNEWKPLDKYMLGVVLSRMVPNLPTYEIDGVLYLIESKLVLEAEKDSKVQSYYYITVLNTSMITNYLKSNSKHVLLNEVMNQTDYEYTLESTTEEELKVIYDDKKRLKEIQKVMYNINTEKTSKKINKEYKNETEEVAKPSGEGRIDMSYFKYR